MGFTPFGPTVNQYTTVSGGVVTFNPPSDIVFANSGGLFRCQRPANFLNSMQYERTPINHSNSPYSIVITGDYIIGCDASAGVISLVLPNISFFGQTFIIKDETGHAAANNITITSAGGLTIDGVTTYTINSNFGSVIIYSNGTGWSTIPTVNPQAPALVATTGNAGFALQNGTPTIFSWTAPNDGNKHRAILYFNAAVTTATTGGQVRFSSIIGGQTGFCNVLAGTNSTGGWPNGSGAAGAPIVVDANTAITLAQVSAMTAGAATVWAELWAS